MKRGIWLHAVWLLSAVRQVTQRANVPVKVCCGIQQVVESVLAFLRLQMRLFRWPEVCISNVLTVRCLHNQTQELCCQFEGM